MATASQSRLSHSTGETHAPQGVADIASMTLNFFGSLKLTVGLFAFSLVLVFAGTLAQHHLNMLEVKQRYFTSWIAWLHFADLMPPAFYPQRDLIPGFLPVSQSIRDSIESALAYKGPVRGFIPIPGGALVGTLLLLNLLAAKITRFHVHASGRRLAAGIGVIALGLLATLGIILAGHSSEGLQGEPPMTYEQLWAMCLGTLAAGWVGVTALAITAKSTTLRITWIVTSVALAAYLIMSLSTGYRIGDPGLRIVWQLAKGLGAGAILLVGCLLIFRKQGGNVLLHFGVGLLMVGQFMFGDRQTEMRLNLVEGQSANSFVNLDEVELTFMREIDGEQQFTAVPQQRLRSAVRTGEPIRDEVLPADVRVLKYFHNSRLADVGEGNLANRGRGLQVQAIEVPGSGGTSSEINLASAYVELLDKDSGESLGTYLISQWFSDRQTLAPESGTGDFFDAVTLAGTDYQLGLRFARTPKSFWVHLNEVRRVDYSGTNTPRDYRSFIRIIDPETGEDRREQIWMNNPLRYRGETFYQSTYQQLDSGRAMTGLQIVRNSGWLIPYVACSITALGMCVHFAGTLRRFVRRRSQEQRLARVKSVGPGGSGGRPKILGPAAAKTGVALRGDAKPTAKASPLTTAQDDANRFAADYDPPPPSQLPVYLSVGAVAVFALLALVPWTAVRNSMRPADRDRQFDHYAAGKIPVQFGGRVMPLAAYASQTLTAISNRSALRLDDAPGAIRDRADGKRKLSPVAWLMEVAIDDPRLDDLPMFRIDASEVRDELGLERRESKLFSLNELRRELERFSELTEAAAKKEPRDQSFKEKKLLELDRRTRAFMMAAVAFRLPVPQEIPEHLFPEGTSARERQMFAIRTLQNRMQAAERMGSPGIIPPAEEDLAASDDVPKWTAFGPAFFDQAMQGVTGQPVERAGLDTFADMLSAYNDKDPQKYNEAVDRHLAAVGAISGAGYTPWKVALERWDQANAPTYVAMMLYIVALVLGCVYLMFDLPRLRSGVWGVLLIALTIHTLVLLSRIVITGRAPVINLYSSAVFIGWAGVIAGIVQERIFRYGEGNLLAAGSGVLALLVAWGLSSGDTMPVLQAVLDTQFWLGTHVITVTLGYAATMVAGLLGIRYLVAGWLGSDGHSLRQIYRSIYGATCFGILFSFVGTVLGGLWADDSWGRFWGWDPKENGALLIVIWNAMMLHARWDAMVGARGFSILAIGGNIVTAWSYFGTNELGLGLHSYGFTEGVLMWLSIFIASQLAFIVAGLLFSPRTPAEDVSAA